MFNDEDRNKYNLQKLIDKMIMDVIFSSTTYKVGRYVSKMKQEDRELLKTAKSEDFYRR